MTAGECCPDCGARIPPGSPAGMCPLCLLRLGVALSAELAGGSRPRVPRGVDEAARGEFGAGSIAGPSASP
ncbi:MAG: hypothetical protein ACYC61_31580, partial [Isosphaeraceae bacterium]